MRVSVLMAVYNGASSVRAAIASIAAQTYEDWELIIVDDGSTDSTLSTLEIIAATDPRIHILHNTRNRGLAASLNTARKYAHGDLLARMDADDVSHPERFQCQVQFMATHPEVDVLGTGLEMVSAAGTTLGCLLLPERHEELSRRIYRENPFAHPSVLMRPSFFDTLGGYDGRLKRAEDVDLWLRGYRQFEYHNLQMPLIKYCVRSTVSLRTIACYGYVLLRASLRERRFISGVWYALRPAVAGVVLNLGLRSPIRKTRSKQL